MNQTDSKPKSDGRRDLYEQIGEVVHVKRGKNDNHRRKNKKPVDLSLFCGQRELCHSCTTELSMERSGMPQTVWERNGLLKTLPVNLLHPTHTHTLAWFNPDSLLLCAFYCIDTRLLEEGFERRLKVG